MTAPAAELTLSPLQLQQIAWQFLGSEFAGENYRDWPIDRRLDAYLQHHRLARVVNNATWYDALMDRVMSSVGAALRSGLLASATTSRRASKAPPSKGMS